MGKPRLIILIRHAQSEGNKNREIHQVIPDHRVKLTEDGWRQAEEAGRRLRHLLRPDDSLQIFTSPYRRTRETTEGLLKTLTAPHDPDNPDSSPAQFSRSKITVYEEPRLREQDFGNFQPCSAEMERMWQERADYGHFFYRIPNGESAADAYDRISGFNESLWRQFGDEDFPSVCVLVTHGLMTRVFLMKWYHWSVEYFEDLRNVNHCEFVLMSRSPTNNKYILDSQLRTWSELRRKKEEEALKNPLRRNTLSSFLANNQKSPQVPAKQWGGCLEGCNHDHASFPRRQQLKAAADLQLPPAAQATQSDRNELDDHAMASLESAAPPTTTNEQPRTALQKTPAGQKPSHPEVFPDYLRPGRDGGGFTTLEPDTPHEMTEHNRLAFAQQPPRSVSQAVKRAPQRRPTPEDIERWTNESGMGRGKQADPLGDEPELPEEDDTAEKEDETVDDLARAEEQDRSLRGSVY